MERLLWWWQGYHRPYHCPSRKDRVMQIPNGKYFYDVKHCISNKNLSLPFLFAFAAFDLVKWKCFRCSLLCSNNMLINQCMLQFKKKYQKLMANIMQTYFCNIMFKTRHVHFIVPSNYVSVSSNLKVVHMSDAEPTWSHQLLSLKNRYS